WRDAISGTMPPHSLWIATCDATMFDPIVHVPSVSVTTAAALFSPNVSMPGIRMKMMAISRLDARAVDQVRQRLREGRACDAAFGDDGGDVLMRSDVERRVQNPGSLRRQPCGAQMRDFLRVALLDRNSAAA